MSFTKINSIDLQNNLQKVLTNIHPKLPMRDKNLTLDFYVNQLKFDLLGDYPDYIIIGKDNIELHFFLFKALNPKENYGQVYIRTNDIEGLFQTYLNHKTPNHPNGHLEIKPWGQKEFALLDPDSNLLTFGQRID
jgi:catechol 2,3-dioxygenase-like lactoylglutathione lyase family enzyme